MLHTMTQQPRYIPLVENGKRDKARRYLDTSTGGVVSRRKAEDLTAKQKASKARRRLPPTAQPPVQPTEQKKTRFIVKKRQTLAKYTTYRIKAYSTDEAVRAFSESRKAQSLKPAFIKIVAKGMTAEDYDTDEIGHPNWRTIVAPMNPDNFLTSLNKIRDLATNRISQVFDAEPLEFAVVMYVPNSEASTDNTDTDTSSE